MPESVSEGLDCAPADGSRTARSARGTRPGSLSPRRGGTLRNPRTTTGVVARAPEQMGRVVPFPMPAGYTPPVAFELPGVESERVDASLQQFERADRMRRVVNVALAAVFFPPALFVISVLWVLHHLLEKDRGQFIYRGRRLGKHKRIFTIYKIRTLSRNAEKELGANLHVPNGKLESSFGRFLRATRLDELPQLVNIIRGDMDFVGPRPVRLEAYERYRKLIPNYDRNFLVRPGLTGYSQFFTPHSTPKQIRSRIDYRFLTRAPSPFRDVGFILTTALTVLRNTVREGFHAITDKVRIVRSKWTLVQNTLHMSALANKRVTRRVAREDVQAFLTDPAFSAHVRVDCELVDINHEALCIATRLPLVKEQPVYLMLETQSPRSGRRKRARCKGVVYRIKEDDAASGNGHRGWGRNGHGKANGNGNAKDPVAPTCYVIFYEPVTHLNRYLIDQYVLRNSIG